MNITPIDQIVKSAEFAAENALGPQANQYPEGSIAFDKWLDAYYAAIQSLSIECVQ